VLQRTLDPEMKLLPPANQKISALGAYIAYPIGKILLRVLTLGRYPPEDKEHSALFVMLSPWWFFVIVITLLYS
jgi:hypothetical protein